MDDGGSQKLVLEFNGTKAKEQRGSGEIDGYSATVQPMPPKFGQQRTGCAYRIRGNKFKTRGRLAGRCTKTQERRGSIREAWHTQAQIK